MLRSSMAASQVSKIPLSPAIKCLVLWGCPSSSQQRTYDTEACRTQLSWDKGACLTSMVSSGRWVHCCLGLTCHVSS